MPKTSDPQPGQLVRVAYHVFAGSLEQAFVGGVLDVVEPGKGPIPRKSGKRIHVIPTDPALRSTLGGWYSVNEVVVIGWHPHVLSAAAHAVLDCLYLATRADRWNEPAVREFPARLSQSINILVRRGLAERRPTGRGRVAAVITPAGCETILAWEAE